MPSNKLKFPLLPAALAGFALACAVLVFYLAAHLYTPRNIGIISGATRLPNMQAITDIPTRKKTFVGLLEPMISRKNHALRSLHKELQQLHDKQSAGQNLSNVEQLRVQRLAHHYRLKTDKLTQGQQIAELLKRVDIIPTSMVLAQAASESGWGTSRFARQGQNLFGQWCYTKGCGLVPKHRARGAHHEVRKFKSLEAAINAYFRNINTHRAYQNVRNRRAQLRHQQKTLTGLMLIKGLHNYSSRGQAYVNELAGLIRYNHFDRFDKNPTQHTAAKHRPQ